MRLATAIKVNIYFHVMDLMINEEGKTKLNINLDAENRMLAVMAFHLNIIEHVK